LTANDERHDGVGRKIDGVNRVVDVEQDRVLCLICGGKIRLPCAAIDVG
jgi:hypothetical protein